MARQVAAVVCCLILIHLNSDRQEQRQACLSSIVSLCYIQSEKKTSCLCGSSYSKHYPDASIRVIRYIVLKLRRVCMNAITTCDGSGATGLALCPSGAMFNHSCTPNCQVWWRGSQVRPLPLKLLCLTIVVDVILDSCRSNMVGHLAERLGAKVGWTKKHCLRCVHCLLEGPAPERRQASSDGAFGVVCFCTRLAR